MAAFPCSQHFPSFTASPICTKFEYEQWLDDEKRALADYERFVQRQAESARAEATTAGGTKVAQQAGKPTFVERGLYWGDAASIYNLDVWRELLGISAVMNTASNIVEIADRLPGVEYCEEPMLDGPVCSDEQQRSAAIASLQRALDFVEAKRQNGGTVLVNCQAGLNRSGATLLGHLLRRRGASTHEEAVKVVHELRERKPAGLANPDLLECAMEVAGLPPIAAGSRVEWTLFPHQALSRQRAEAVQAARAARVTSSELQEEPHEGEEMADDDPFSMMTPVPLGIREVIAL